MLFLTNRQDQFEQSRRDTRIVNKGQNVLVTGNKVWFKSQFLANQRKEGLNVFFAESLGGAILPRRAFGIAIVDQVMIHNEVNLTILSQSINHGIVFPYFVPSSFNQFFMGMRDYQRDMERQEAVKERRKAMEDEFKAEKEAWKTRKNEIKEENEKIMAEFNEALKDVPEAAKQYVQAPQMIEVPAKPEEPNYPEMPRIAGIQDRFYKPETSLVWKILRRFEYLQVLGTNLGLMKKREKELMFNVKNLSEISVGEISIDDFYEYINSHNVDSASAKELKQSFADPVAVELFADVDFTITDLMFSEETDESIILPPLAPIKPMHAASMLAGGIGEYYKEVILNGETVALKAAIVKEPTSRTTVINGREVTEVIEQNIQKLGVYNTLRREFRILG